jgi:hypothetical protein
MKDARFGERRTAHRRHVTRQEEVLPSALHATAPAGQAVGRAAAMAGFEAPGGGPGQPPRPPFTPVYAFHEPFAWSTARLLQARRGCGRVTCACSHTGIPGRARRRFHDETRPRLSRLSRPPHGHRWARWLAPGWSAPWPWCSSYASFSVRCVHNTSPAPWSCLRSPLPVSPPNQTNSHALPPFTQRASRGHKSLAAAVSASVKERAVLFAASPHEW